MKAILYNAENSVELIYEEVQSFDGTNLLAAFGSARGINCSVLIVDDSVKVKVGDTIVPADYTDIRDQLPESDPQKIARLEAETAALRQRIGDLNGKFCAFTDAHYARIAKVE